MAARRRIIGGIAGLAELPTTLGPSPWFFAQPHLLMVNGRSCVCTLIERLRPRRVWLPSYLCASLVAGVRKATSDIDFYEIDERLRIGPLDGVREQDLVVFINHFGVPYEEARGREAKERGAFVLEDAAWSLFSRTNAASDFVLLSPSKVLGVPDGGILISKRDVGLDGAGLEEPPEEWWRLAYQARAERREFDQGRGDRSWFPMSQESKASAPIGGYRMSRVSELLLRHAFDYAELARRCSRNHEILSRELPSPLSATGPGIAPTGLAITVRDRKLAQESFFAEEIYPQIHWPIEGLVPSRYEGSHRLAQQVLTIPCDYRYDEEDMARIASVARRAIG